GGIADALERTADASRLAGLRRLDSELLELCGRNLVADVESASDERRLLELLSLDPCEGPVLGEPAGRRRRLNHRGIDLSAGQRRFDQRLALLEQARTRLGRRADAHARTRDQPRGRKARPGDDDEQDRLEGSGDTEAAKLRPVMDEQVAVAEQCRRTGQNLRHYVPAPKAAAGAPGRTVPSFQPQELPSPQPDACCPPRIGEGDTASGWLTNSTMVPRQRDETQSNCGESFNSPVEPSVSSKFNLLCSAAILVAESQRELFTPPVAIADGAITPGVGPRRPNAARALWKESD